MKYFPVGLFLLLIFCVFYTSCMRALCHIQPNTSVFYLSRRIRSTIRPWHEVLWPTCICSVHSIDCASPREQWLFVLLDLFFCASFFKSSLAVLFWLCLFTWTVSGLLRGTQSYVISVEIREFKYNSVEVLIDDICYAKCTNTETTLYEHILIALRLKGRNNNSKNFEMT
jgi:hypothetical protein